MEKDKIPGLTIGFIKDDYVWVKGFGFADVENKVPAMADSAYRLALATLGMNDTRIDEPLEIIPNRVRGYQLVNGELRNSEFFDVSSRFAAGGTRGTVVDLLKFLKGLNDGRLLTTESMSLMFAPMKTRDSQPISYAMGWQIPPFKNRRSIVINDGGQQETRTFILNFPDQDFAMAFAMNLEADVYAPLIFQLYELVLDEKLEVPRG